jgi:hypothetical protein
MLKGITRVGTGAPARAGERKLAEPDSRKDIELIRKNGLKAFAVPAHYRYLKISLTRSKNTLQRQEAGMGFNSV